MSEAVRIKRNSFFALLSQLLRLATNFFLFVGIARFYGVEAFGQFTTAHTLASMFLLLADFGFDSLLPTEIARQRHRIGEIVHIYFSMKVTLAIGATFAMQLVPWFVNFTPETRTLIHILSLYVFFASINGFFFALFKGFEEFHHETGISFVTNVALLFLLVLLGWLRSPLWAIAVGFVATRAIGIALSFRTAARLSGIHRLHLSLTQGKEFWHRVVVFGMYSIFGNLFLSLDTLLISVWRGDYDVGIYQAVFKIAVLSVMGLDVLATTMLPVMTRLHAEDRAQWQRIGHLMYKTLILVSLPIALLLFVYSEQIVAIIYGDSSFRESVPILRLFSLVVFIRFAVETFGLMITTSQRQGRRLLITLIATVFNAALNSYAIPHHGIWGAGVVAVITNVLVGVGYGVVCWSWVKNWLFDPRVWIPFVTLPITGFLLWPLRAVSFWYLAPLTVAIYVALCVCFSFTKVERQHVFATWSSW